MAAWQRFLYESWPAKAFGDDWTGANGASWDATKWAVGSAGTHDLLGNRGRQAGPYGVGGTYFGAKAVMSAVADTETLVHVARTTVTASEVYARTSWTSGAAVPTTGYSAFLNSDGAFRIERWTAGAVAVVLASTTTALTAPGSCWMRFRAEGSALKAKVWADGAAEPAAWTLETTDSAHTAAGVAGLGMWAAGITGTAEQSWDGLTVESLTASPVTKSDSDAGTGTDGVDSRAATSTDLGAGTDTLSARSAQGAEDAGGADSVASRALTAAESGGGTDAPSLLAAGTITEAGAGSDGAAVRAAWAVLEVGAGADGGAAMVAWSSSDTGSGVDLRSGLSVALGGSDTAGGTELVAVLLAALTASEAVAAADDGVRSEQGSTKSATDAGVAVDAALSLMVAVATVDLAAGADAVLSVLAALAGGDAGTGADAGTTDAQGLGLTGADAGVATEAGVVAASLGGAETATGTDVSPLVAVAVVTAEVGNSGEGGVAVQVLAVVDAGAGSDLASAPVVSIAVIVRPRPPTLYGPEGVGGLAGLYGFEALADRDGLYDPEAAADAEALYGPDLPDRAGKGLYGPGVGAMA